MQDWCKLKNDLSQDPFSEIAFSYAEYWAIKTQEYMAKGFSFNKAVKKAMTEADEVYVLNGRFWNRIPNTLYHYWWYGDQLKRWLKWRKFLHLYPC